MDFFWVKSLRYICSGASRAVFVKQLQRLIRPRQTPVLEGLPMAGYHLHNRQLREALELGAPHQPSRLFIIFAYPQQLIQHIQPSRWEDQMGEMLLRQGAISRLPAFKPIAFSAIAEFLPGLLSVPIGVPTRRTKLFRARYLAPEEPSHQYSQSKLCEECSS